LRPTERTRDSELTVAGIIERKQTWSLECMVTLCLAGPEAEREFCGPITDGSDCVAYELARQYLARRVANPLQATGAFHDRVQGISGDQDTHTSFLCWF
jgi:hypothetical protein